MDKVEAQVVDYPYNDYIDMLNSGYGERVNALATMRLVDTQNETNRLLAELINRLKPEEIKLW